MDCVLRCHYSGQSHDYRRCRGSRRRNSNYQHQRNDSTIRKHPFFCSRYKTHHPDIRISEQRCYQSIVRLLYSLILVATTMYIKASYDAKNGAPTADTKVFFKWFYVKTVTCEKSDEMMGYAQLAE